MASDPDATVRIAPPSRKRRLWPAALLALLGAAGIAGTAYLLLPSRAPPPPPAAIVTHALPPLATEAEILAGAPATREVRRFAPQPEIVVLQFSNLAQQAATLNRAAALIEKAEFPRDRVLADDELDRRIRAGGETPETFYYGHDYRADDLLRFFAEAEREGVVLTAEERWLRQAMAEWGWRQGGIGALISLTRTDATAGLDAAMRATIVRHELSHGAYFTRPDYAAFVQHFFDDVLTAPERDAVRTFLRGENYDVGQRDLVVNEMQAYLIHTADQRFFDPGALGISRQRMGTLRGLFVSGMPPGWLRDCTSPREPAQAQ